LRSASTYVLPPDQGSRHLPQSFFQRFFGRSSASYGSGACSSPQRPFTVPPHRTSCTKVQVFHYRDPCGRWVVAPLCEGEVSVGQVTWLIKGVLCEPDQLGHWEKTCGPTKNIPTDRVVEGPLLQGFAATLICLTARFLRLEALLGGTNLKILNRPS
jgi:hypothetical protein